MLIYESSRLVANISGISKQMRMNHNSCLKNPDEEPLLIIQPMATPAARIAPLDRRDDDARLTSAFFLPFDLDVFSRKRVSIFPSAS